MKSTILASVLISISIALTAVRGDAASFTFYATDTATVQTAGPVGGPGAKDILAVAGSSYGPSASFGVAEFDFAQMPTLQGVVTQIVFQITLTNTSDSANGPLSFYCTPQNAVDIQATNANLNFQAGMNGSASVDSDLAPLSFLHAAEFTGLGVGTPTFGYGFSPPHADFLAYVQNQIATDGKVRLVFASDSATTFATYAGLTNAIQAPPRLIFEFVPEPSSLALIACGMVGMASRHSRKSRHDG